MTDLKTYVLARYKLGDLATLEEGALIAGVTRMTVRRWLIEAGIDWQVSRGRYIAKLRSRAVDAERGIVRRAPTKRQLRRVADRAKAEWDAKQKAASQDRGRDYDA